MIGDSDPWLVAAIRLLPLLDFAQLTSSIFAISKKTVRYQRHNLLLGPEEL